MKTFVHLNSTVDQAPRHFTTILISKNNQFISNFMNQLTVPSLQQQNSNFFETDGNQTDMGSNVKKKKLTGYSRSSSNLPQINFNDMSNSFNVASFTDEEFTRNLSNSSYNSSGISSSDSYNANLSNCFVND